MASRKRKSKRTSTSPEPSSDTTAQASSTSADVSHLPVINAVPPPKTVRRHKSSRIESTVASVETTIKTRTSKRRLWLMFSIGGLLGAILAGLVYQSPDIMPLMNMDFLQDMGVNVDGWLDLLPEGLLREAKDMRDREKEAIGRDAFSVGLAMKELGLEANLPLVMIPGVISTGLESWGTSAKSRKYFRKRLWGSWNMLRAMVSDQENWKQHVMLDKETGLDPPEIKMRAAQGFDATDFFITGYWIWSKVNQALMIIENLATIGYDPTNSWTAAYDWRLSYINLETRDKYFTKLKVYIETTRMVTGKKVLLVSHSMGSQVVFYFFKWVEANGFGNGGDHWVEDNIDSFINVSGCMLGATKGVPAIISGEMKDTAQLNQFALFGLEKFFSREDRAEILRAMPGISSMLPKGGEAIWGNSTWAPDDVEGQPHSFGHFIRIAKNGWDVPRKNLTVSESIKYILDSSEDWYKKMLVANYSHGVAHTVKEVEENEKKPEKWLNPLEVRLPKAPSLKIYCFYGVGKPTERAYYYKKPDNGSSLDMVIDNAIGAADGADRGVVLGEGDGTISVMSAGYMCAKGWKLKRYNPSGAAIKIVEMAHEPDRFDIRGGPKTGDHVDILGSQTLNELILRVAAGHGDSIEEKIVSNIYEYSARVPIND